MPRPEWYFLSLFQLLKYFPGPLEPVSTTVIPGLVVALPAVKRVDFSWPGLVASRFVRLFLPAWASIVLATILLFAVPRTAAQVTGGSWLAGQVPHSWRWSTVLGQWSLMISSVPQNNVLWTLRWELAFSLLLPGYLVVAMALRRWWAPVGALAVGLSVLGAVGHIEAMMYLPVFFLGTLLAVRLRALERWSEGRGAKRVLLAVLVAGALVLIGQWLLLPVVPMSGAGNHALIGLESLGAAGVVVAAAGATRFRTLLEGAVPQFLGRISFSLYLVHLPILATLAYALGDWNWPAVGLIGVPVALLAGWGFFRLVEKPLHRVARDAKRGAGRTIERAVREIRA